MQSPYRGRYERVERMGNGAYGVIYKVREIPSGEICIAKHIPLHNIDRAKALQQFKILERLRHRYIVRSMDSFEEEDELILCMEYGGQKDLGWHIDQRRKSGLHFSQFLVTNWILQLLLAVGFMHSNKIVHRDLKPQNVFVDAEMNLKAGDFGISKLLDFTNQNCQTSAGTPSYMAPEMVESEDYSFKADIWSLGCVIYELCALEKLFPVKDAQDRPIGLLRMMDMIKHKEIKPIPSLYSDDLRKLVRKMLSRDPQRRPLTSQLLKDKFLVQLMVNTINQKGSLSHEYSKGQQAPSLSSSLLDRQAHSVKQQLSQLSLQVGEKMAGMKDRKVQRNHLQEYERDLRQKMKEVEAAVQAAFQELYSNGKFQKGDEDTSRSRLSGKAKANMAKMQESSLSNSSDATIQSVQLNSNRQAKNDSGLSLAESNMVESLNVESRVISSPARKEQKEASLRKSPQKLEDFETTVQSQYAHTVQNELEDTLQSAYELTMNNPQALAATMSKLDLLKDTLQKNPEAVLSKSFLECTLSLTGEKSMPRRLRESPLEVSGSVEFDLTRREPSQQTLKAAFDRKKESPPEPQEDYEEDFEEYSQNVGIHSRRQSEIEAMLSLYQEELSRQDSLSGMSTGFKQRQKFLVMSEIKEQSSEGGSVISSALSRNGSSLDP